MPNDSSVKIDIDGSKYGVEGSLKKFKRLCESAGVLKEYRKRKEFKKPSVRKKEKTESAQKRKAKEASKFRRSTYKV
ncbi:MAG: 30S ribosomal protein S21 [Bdellovibrionales bacterium GWA2_49_15]|nr:30S ribosomal protein S21 [Bdellovibrio sp.]OFZ14786.1 MAG: 30S ribosomal protein S21 [Bdellovibrionales bacterium GWA2_49_15]HAZ14363.1 30S ribosomal protein S21 [Bdellovibrionales bacterium]